MTSVLVRQYNYINLPFLPDLFTHESFLARPTRLLYLCANIHILKKVDGPTHHVFFEWRFAYRYMWVDSWFSVLIIIIIIASSYIAHYTKCLNALYNQWRTCSGCIFLRHWQPQLTILRVVSTLVVMPPEGIDCWNRVTILFYYKLNSFFNVPHVRSG